MSIQKDSEGRRSVQTEVIVPGTPEEVWQAIATGPGISAWFVPTKVEGREGGSVTANFGPGMDSVAKVVKWEPPQRFVAESRDDMGPEDPTIATEWIVEAQGGGTCLVRVVHSWQTTSDKWDQQFEGHSQGWKAFFRILKLYLTHFRGQSSALVQLNGIAAGEKADAWARVTESLGIGPVAAGQPFRTAPPAPPASGQIERVGEAAYPEELLLRFETPAPGVAHFFAMAMGGAIFVSVRLFFYGDPDAVATAAAAEEPRWQAWIGELFPPPSGAPIAC